MIKEAPHMIKEARTLPEAYPQYDFSFYDLHSKVNFVSLIFNYA
jgi:hypothetical protein